MSHVSPTNSLLDSDYAWAVIDLFVAGFIGAYLGCLHKKAENTRIPSLVQTAVQGGGGVVNKED